MNRNCGQIGEQERVCKATRLVLLLFRISTLARLRRRLAEGLIT